MTTGFTGMLGLPGSMPGLIQMGGPVTTPTWAKTKPTTAQPLVAHIYQSDGSTFVQSLGPLVDRPVLRWTSNGSYDPITLELPAQPGANAARFGISVFGSATFGGSLSQGGIVKLTEEHGDGSVLYTGVIESLPETASATGTKHEVVLKPIAFQLDDSYVSLKYTQPTDVAQMVRDAVTSTFSLSCDQASVPVQTGILAPTGSDNGALDFTNRPAKEVLDTARSIAGPNWFWFVDATGRVWFQPMGSGARYTARMGADYEVRTSNGGSIEQLRNDVPIVGGVPKGGTQPAFARYVGSIGIYGRRTLNPPLSLPGITDQPTLQAVANTVGAVLDRIWQRVELKILASYPKRITMAQPGGAMLRYWEPSVNPLLESASGTGNYTGPFIVQELTDDGLYQQITAGDVPVTDQRDLSYMTDSALSRAVANTLLYVPAALNVQGVVSQSGGLATAPDPPAGLPSAQRWVLDRNSFRAFDGSANNYGAPSGIGVAVEITSTGKLFLGGAAAQLVIDDASGTPRVELGPMPARGISPAQNGLRVNDASGNPIFDTLGLIAIVNQLGQGSFSGPTNFTTTTPTVLTGTSLTFSLARAQRVLLTANGQGNSTGNSGRIDIFLDGSTDWAGWLTWGVSGPTVSSAFVVSDSLAAGSHTYDLRAFVTATPGTFTVNGALLSIYGLGS